MAERYDGVLYPSLRGYTLLLIIVAVTAYYGVIYICILLGLGFDVYDCEYHVLAIDCSGERTLGGCCLGRDSCQAAGTGGAPSMLLLV